MTESEVKEIVSGVVTESFGELLKVVPLLKWFLGGAFALGIWVASQQFTLNAVAAEVEAIKVVNRERSKLDEQSRTDIAVIKSNLESISEDLSEIKSEVKKKQ